MVMDLEDYNRKLSSLSSSLSSQLTSSQILLDDPSDLSYVDLGDENVNQILLLQVECLPCGKVEIIDFWK